MYEVVDIATGRVIATYSDAYTVRRTITQQSQVERAVAETERARHWLRRRLAEADFADVVKADAATRDIGPGALRRAKAAEGIVSHRTGFGPRSRFVWAYPDTD